MAAQTQPIVFLSHSSEDAASASTVRRSLESLGLRCWKAPEDIIPSESWPGAITKAIRESTAMVIVVSARSVASPEVSKEITLAMKKRMAIIPLRVDAANLPDEWEYHFANIQWLDVLDGDLEGACARIGQHLHEMFELHGEPLSAAPQTAPQADRLHTHNPSQPSSRPTRFLERKRAASGSKANGGYSNSRIMRRCGQLGIPYERAIASPYFTAQGLRRPSMFI